MKRDYYKQAGRLSGMMMKGMLCATCFALHASFFTPKAMAQGMVTEIKVFAINDEDSIKPFTQGYKGTDDTSLDFRKGKGGGFVFAGFKTDTVTSQYITAVAVETRAEYGIEHNIGDKQYTPVPYFQAKAHHDNDYRGGLNGRNYWCYGGSYDGQPHVYVSRTGNKDFNNRVLKNAYVTVTKPNNLASNQEVRGGYAGGGRYFVFEWHTHESKYRATGDINWHKRYCDLDACGLTVDERHEFHQEYGVDVWTKFPSSDKDSLRRQQYHYKKCLKCGEVVLDKHKFATYSSDWKNHNKRCLICDYVIEAGHKNFGKQRIPVDEYYHAIYCDDCGFLKKLQHEKNDNRFIEKQDCEHTVVKYTCRQCYHEAYFEEPGIGHDYDDYGICRRKNCLHPYEQPGVEPLDSLGTDSVYVIKNFGNLYWMASFVNNRRAKTNIRLANDLTAKGYMRYPWKPIGDTDSTAFQGTFDGGGHFISMLQTEEPVAGCGYRGLFGVIAKGATVKNLSMASCNIRGWDYVGAVAGVNEGTIDSCHVAFSLVNSIGTGMNLGGICGLNKGTINKCITESDVWVGGVRDYAGGICGTNAKGTLSGNVFKAICGSGSDAVLPEAAAEQ